MIKVLKTSILVSFLFSWPVFGQWYYSLFLEQEYNTNPFGIPDSVQAEQISRISSGIQKDWEQVSLQYFGSLIRYHEQSDHNLYWHQLSMAGGESFTWNLTAENRLNQDIYNIYDYWAVRLGGIKSITTEQTLWRLGGNASLNHFLQLSELNNLLFSISTSLNRSFVTRTSLIGSIVFNYKYYLEASVAETPGDTLGNLLAAVSSVNQGGPGPGHGGGGGSGYVYTSTVEQPSPVQLVFSLRMAQSVLTGTGLAVHYTGRLNLNEYDRSISGLMYGYISESQIFDDPMGYESNSVGAELTQLLPYQMTARLALYYQDKNYVAQGIYSDAENFDETVLREDIYRTWWFTLGKRFNLSFTDSASLLLQINYQWIQNDSNSYWYHFKSQFASLGLQFDI